MSTIEVPAEEVTSETAELIADLRLLPSHFTETGVIQRLVTQLTEKDLALTAQDTVLAAVRKLHVRTQRPAITECSCGAIVCTTLRALEIAS